MKKNPTSAKFSLSVCILPPTKWNPDIDQVWLSCFVGGSWRSLWNFLFFLPLDHKVKSCRVERNEVMAQDFCTVLSLTVWTQQCTSNAALNVCVFFICTSGNELKHWCRTRTRESCMLSRGRKESCSAGVKGQVTFKLHPIVSSFLTQ